MRTAATWRVERHRSTLPARSGGRHYRGMHGPHFPSTKPHSRVTIPDDRCYPLARLVFAEMQRQRVTYETLEWNAGVLVETFKSWRKGVKPGLAAIQAALGALGWELEPVPISPLPSEAAAALDDLRKQWRAEDSTLFQLLGASRLAPVTPRAD